MKPKVIIYTDGACKDNPGPGGWGALLKWGAIKKELYGHSLYTTNNQMEITAALEALKILKKSCYVIIYTDSKYLQQGITEWIENWQRKNWRNSKKELVKNADLWQNLYNETLKHDITWHWVKGHANNIGNIEADRLAVIGKEKAINIIRDRKYKEENYF